MRRWRRVGMDYGIEAWLPLPSRVLLGLIEATLWAAVVLAGMGLAWVLMVAHRSGVTP